jgi:hypothetical protein
VTRTEREHPRYAHEAAVTVLVDGKRVAGRTNNVSRGGLCAIVGDAIAIGCDLDVEIALLFDDDSRSAPLRLPARVVWCTLIDDAYQLGLSFRSLDAERTKYLTVFLSHLDAARDEPAPRGNTVDERFR